LIYKVQDFTRTPKDRAIREFTYLFSLENLRKYRKVSGRK